ncbi:MAG: RsmD family RNA methyltransferase [Leptospiraceae bacterium]|nr:RsmD family RNA methyltransferase [Leptospiraceae bacterium]
MTTKITLEIQSGSFKGKKIFPPAPIQGHSNFTPSLLKKTIFSVIESEFLSGNIQKENAVFIDLFSASGQMGVEAVSRGIKRSILFELDAKRFQLLKKTISGFEGDFSLNHKDSFRALNKISLKDDEFPIFFLDPPYSFWKENKKIFDFCKEIEDLFKSFIILIQCPNEISRDGYEIKGKGNNRLLVRKV